MRLAPRMALQYAAGLVLLGVLLLSAAPAVAQRVMTGSLGPVLLRQARGVAALLDGQAGGPRPPGARLAELAAVRLSRLYVDGEVLVVDGTGLVRWNSGTFMGDLRGWRVDPTLLAAAGGADYGLHEVLDGVPAVVAVAPLLARDGTGTSGAVVIFRPLRELGEVRRSIAAWLVAGTALALAGALVAGWTVGYGLVRRLRLIQQAAGELAEGNLSRRVEVWGGDEIADLAAHFNHMAGRLEALVGELRRSERLRRSMLAVVSHELRTPVTVIRGLAEAMRDGLVEGGGDVRQHAGRIVAEAERLGRLIEDLFDVARIEAGQLDVRLRRLEAARWLAEALPGLEALARQHGASFEASLAPGLEGVVVEADPDRLGQVVTNLVGNAARHAGPGGRVRLATRVEGGLLHVEVADDGPGIDPADLPHVFEPFYRGGAAARGRGAGLGLSIARAIVEAHGGKIEALSRPGEGAAFRFILPLAPGAGASAGAGTEGGAPAVEE